MHLHKPHEPAPEEPTDVALLRELKENNRLLKLNAAGMMSFRWRFLGGLYQGVGTVVGATVVIAIVIRILAKLATVETVGPYVREIQTMLERNRPPVARNAPDAGSETPGSQTPDAP